MTCRYFMINLNSRQQALCKLQYKKKQYKFSYAAGTYLSTIAPYYGTYRFDRNAHKYKFDKAAVKKICKSWNTEFIGRNCAPKGLKTLVLCSIMLVLAKKNLVLKNYSST